MIHVSFCQDVYSSYVDNNDPIKSLFYEYHDMFDILNFGLIGP